MVTPDKVLTIVLSLMAVALFVNGIYLVGSNGLLLLVGALVVVVVTVIWKNAELRLLTQGMEKKKSPSIAETLGEEKKPVGAAANKNDKVMKAIIGKRKHNQQQGLLGGLSGLNPNVQIDDEQAKADHEYLVEMARKKQEAMRTAKDGPPTDPEVKKKIMEKQEAYVKELMVPTIIPQRELAEKASEEEK